MSGSGRRDAPASGTHHAGGSVLQECLRIHSESPPRSVLAAFFGRSPLRYEARAWFSSAVGELAVSTALRDLGAGWVVLESEQTGTRATQVGHLVVGPPGVFAITALVADGRRVSVSADGLTVGRHRATGLASAQAEAERGSATLGGIAGAPIAVTPLVAIVGASLITGATTETRPTSRARVKGKGPVNPGARNIAAVVPGVADVLSVKRVVRSLSLRQTTLSSAAVVGIATIAAAGGWQRLGRITDDAERRQQRFERLRREVEAAKRRRRGWAIGATIAVVAGIGFGVLAAFGMLMGTEAAIALVLGSVTG